MLKYNEIIKQLSDGDKIRIRSKANPEYYFDAEFMDMTVVPAAMGEFVVENLGAEPICVHKTTLKEGFVKALDNDLNTSLAVTAIYDVLKAKVSDATKLALIKDFDKVLCLNLLEAAAKVRASAATATAAAGSDEYTKTNENQFPTQQFIDRVAPYTDKIYVTSLSVSYSGNQTVSMNGNIVVSSTGGAVTVNCSNNNTILKNTEWFKANRTWPTNGV